MSTLAESRAAQGLPPTITDPVILGKIAGLLGLSVIPQPTEKAASRRQRREAKAGAK